MKLSRKRLRKLQDSCRLTLTPEQEVIMLLWYGKNSEYDWTETDFNYGIDFVMRFYPNHRPYSYMNTDVVYDDDDVPF